MRATITAVLVLLGATQPQVGETGKPAKTERTGPLAALPSAPGPHVAKVKALKDSSWLELPAPRPDPEWGPARGRSWSCRMPYAPGLGGAFIFGNGPHGAMFKGKHYGDELYFYDANAHAWICCYPGFDVTRYGEVTINEDGFEEIDGHPTPIAPMVHSYTMLSYDTHRRRFMCTPASNSDYWGPRIPKRYELHKSSPEKLNRRHASPWIWQADTGRWTRFKTGTQGPDPRSPYGCLQHLPWARKAFYYKCRSELAFYYDPEANEWTQVRPKGPKPPFGIDMTACLDEKRKRLYFGGGSYPVVEKGANALWIYDFATDSLIDPKPAGAPCGGSNSYSTNIAMMHFDVANDVVLLLRVKGTAQQRGVFVYDPEKNEWTTASAEIPGDLQVRQNSGFYHPVWNAHVIYSAPDGRTDGKMYVYRYKRRSSQAAGSRRPP